MGQVDRFELKWHLQFYSYVIVYFVKRSVFILCLWTWHNILLKITCCFNQLISPIQIYATVESGSLAIAASTLDSLLDLMAGGILWLTHLSMKSINIYKYPIGKLRVQPVGIIIFAAVMATLGTNLFWTCLMWDIKILTHILCSCLLYNFF